MRKPYVDPGKCVGDGICTVICPETFEMGEDGLAYVVNDNPGQEHEQHIEDAIKACPSEAIGWKD